MFDERWSFDGNFESPTFSPSLLNTWQFVGGKPEKRCHLFVKNGQIEYCSDSTHSLAGKTVPMVDRDWSDYGFGDKPE